MYDRNIIGWIDLDSIDKGSDNDALSYNNDFKLSSCTNSTTIFHLFNP